MAIKVKVRDDSLADMQRLVNGFVRLEPETRQGVRRNIQRDMAKPLALAMKQNADNAHARRAANNMWTSAAATSATVIIGKGGDQVGKAVLLGSEFGGRKRGKVRYAKRSPKGRPYSLRRRTTMQFRPHLTGEGYWAHPAADAMVPRLTEALGRILHDAVRGVF